MEYLIYTDESTLKGEFYSDFFGGVLVRSTDYEQVKQLLDDKKIELNLFNEIKWTKVTENYLEKYKQMIDLFFDLVAQDKLKVRIMFRQNAIVPLYDDSDPVNDSYHLLYYQFIKHAFGLRYHMENPESDTYVRLFFDKIPDTKIQNEHFKAHVYGLQGLQDFQKAKLKIRMEDIVEIDSSKHSIQQCMDIVLGSIAFRLNNKHKEKIEGTNRRGKKTIAKEKLYKHILQHIKKAIHSPNFNIGISTGAQTKRDYWEMPYRHWCFVPKEFREDPSKYKK